MVYFRQGRPKRHQKRGSWSVRSVRVLGLLMGIIPLMALVSGKSMTPVMNWRAFSIGIVTYGVGASFVVIILA